MSNKRKVIITCAVTGGLFTPSMSPYLPCGVNDISQQAIDAANAGAAMLHLHARDDDGQPTADPDKFRTILSRVKNNCDAIIAITTGGAAGMTEEERMACIPLYKPEVASFNCGSVNFSLVGLAAAIQEPKYDWEIPFLKGTDGNVFHNPFSSMKRWAKVMKEAGTVPDLEIFDLGQLNNVWYLVQNGYLEMPLYFTFVTGLLGGIPFSPENLMYFVNHVKSKYGNKANFGMICGGTEMFRAETLSVLLGGNVRLGLEDSLYIKPNGELAVSNARQVEKAVKILRNLDYEVATPEEARAILHTKGKDKVNF